MAEKDNTFQNTVEALFRGMDSFITTKTVVGEAIHIDDTILLPLVDVSFGVGAGAFAENAKNNAGGGMGGKISPSAVLVIIKNFAHLKCNTRLFVRTRNFLYIIYNSTYSDNGLCHNFGINIVANALCNILEFRKSKVIFEFLYKCNAIVVYAYNKVGLLVGEHALNKLYN